MRSVFILYLLLVSFTAGLTGCGGAGEGAPPVENPHPILTSVTPGDCMVGSSDLTLTATGTNFISSSKLQWDGNPLSTTYNSSTSLQAQLPATNFLQAAVHHVNVVSPSPGGGASNQKAFIVIVPSGTRISILDVSANDIVWDAKYKKIYASQSSTAPSNPNSITTIDPIAGTVTASQSVGVEPSLLAVSDDSQYLYASLNSSGSIQRFIVPALTQDISFSLGSNPPYGPYQATSLEVAPGNPHTIAVVLGVAPFLGMGPGVIYDDSIPRPATIPSVADGGPGVGQIQWGRDASSLCAEPYGIGGGSIYCYFVDSSGVALRNRYGQVGPLSGIYLHFDPGTGFLYADSGSVSDPESGKAIGFYYPNYIWLQNQRNVFVISDASLNRVFVLGQTPDQYAAGKGDYTIQAFDPAHFTAVGSMIIPSVIGSPTRFIRWGDAGLAFSTADFPSPYVPRKVYLIDGSFVNGTVAADSSTGTDYGPFPSITAIAPETATAGAASLTLTVTGQGFTTDSVVQWNAQALDTTFVNSTSLQAQIPSAELVTGVAVAVTVSNPSTIAALSNPLIFTVIPPQAPGTTIAAINLAAQDIAWDQTRGKLYAAVLDFDPNYGNSVAIVNPYLATIEGTKFVGSDPMLIRVAASDLAYVGFLGSGSVQQFSLPDFDAGIQWNLGYEPLFGTEPFYPFDLQVAPGLPHTTAVSIADWWTIPYALGGVAIYDDNIPRPLIAPGWGNSDNLYDFLQWGPSSAVLYAMNAESGPQTDFYTLSVGNSGVSLLNEYKVDYDNDFRIHFDPGTGYVYEDNGRIIDPSNGTIVGSFGASGYAIPDSDLNRVFILGQTPGQSGSLTIEMFDQTTLASVGSIVVPSVIGIPASFIRWGTSGLAFTTLDSLFLGGALGGFVPGGGMLYIIDSTMVNAPNSSLSMTIPTGHVENTWRTPVGPRSRRHKPGGLHRQ